MSVSEALRRPRNESEIEGAAPERLIVARFVALCPADDAESAAKSHSADRNKQLARRGYGAARMPAGSRLAALISFTRFRPDDLAREREWKGTRVRKYIVVCAGLPMRPGLLLRKRDYISGTYENIDTKHDVAYDKS